MGFYRKKPVVIEAVQWHGNYFGTMQHGCEITQDWKHSHLGNVETLEGPLRVSPGDWIIKGVQGEFYPCKHDIFEATYEPAEGEADGTISEG